jgi:hypothetical protein
MKASPAPNVPGNTDSERMSNALNAVLTVSKTDLLRAEEGWKKLQAQKKKAKKNLPSAIAPAQPKDQVPRMGRP